MFLRKFFIKIRFFPPQGPENGPRDPGDRSKIEKKKEFSLKLFTWTADQLNHQWHSNIIVTARIVGFPTSGKAANSQSCCFWKPTEDFHCISLGFPCWETQEYWQCTLFQKFSRLCRNLSLHTFILHATPQIPTSTFKVLCKCLLRKELLNYWKEAIHIMVTMSVTSCNLDMV